MKKAAKDIGTWDVLVLNAGYMPDQGSIAKADVDDWWLPFEVSFVLMWEMRGGLMGLD